MATPYDRLVELRLARGAHEKPGYFKTCGVVLTDTIVNGIYGIGNSKIADSCRKMKEANPRLGAATELAAKYGFWVGTAYMGAALSRHTGPAAGYTLAYVHPFIISAGMKATKSRDIPFNPLKPSLGTFLATFGLVELACTPVFICTIDRAVHMANSVSAGLAAASVALASAVSATLEYLGFRFLWKRFVLRDMEKGDLADELKGFLSEFNPLRLFNSRHAAPIATNAGQYVGQIWGIIESLWFWVHLSGFAVAAAMTQVHNISPDNFIDQFFQNSALWGKKFLEAIVLAKCCIMMEKKIHENSSQAHPHEHGGVRVPD